MPLPEISLPEIPLKGAPVPSSASSLALPDLAPAPTKEALEKQSSKSVVSKKRPAAACKRPAAQKQRKVGTEAVASEASGQKHRKAKTEDVASDANETTDAMAGARMFGGDFSGLEVTLEAMEELGDEQSIQVQHAFSSDIEPSCRRACPAKFEVITVAIA